MNTVELLEELCKRDKVKIQWGIFKLLTEGKLDYTVLSEAYVKYLKATEEDNYNKLIEAETIILESFWYKKVKSEDRDKGKGKLNWKHTQRALYFLNMLKRICMTQFNEDYNYNEEKAKELSWYERNKNM